MKRIVRRVLVGAFVLIAVVYGSALVYFRVKEPYLVFQGAARTDSLVVPGDEAEFPWDSLRVQADDGTSTFLLVSRLDDPNADRWAIFFHGTGMLVSRSGGRYELLREAGFNVLAVEFRGYGASKAAGPPTEEGAYRDAMAGWTYLTESVGVPSGNIVVYGFSLGSGLATYVATQADVAGLITEGAFTSVTDIAAPMYPWFPVRLFIRYRLENLRRAERISKPWLVFHGRNDQSVPFSHAEALASVAPGARLVPLDSGHDDGVMSDRDVSLMALRTFAREVFGAADEGR